jgi:hypothetical protein
MTSPLPARTVRQAGRSSPKERMSAELKETTLIFNTSSIPLQAYGIAIYAYRYIKSTVNGSYSQMSNLTLNPRALFLIDGLGALLTALFLYGILRTFNEYFGMPPMILTYLSLMAVLFCIYSITCFFLLTHTWRPFLAVISISNLLYCCATVGLVIYYYQTLTILGVIYFLAEVVIVCGLAFIELKTVTLSDEGVQLK